MPQGSEAVHDRIATAHCPKALRQCIAPATIPNAFKPCGTMLQEFRFWAVIASLA